jgi:hypothetical protein
MKNLDLEEMFQASLEAHMEVRIKDFNEKVGPVEFESKAVSYLLLRISILENCVSELTTLIEHVYLKQQKKDKGGSSKK